MMTASRWWWAAQKTHQHPKKKNLHTENIIIIDTNHFWYSIINKQKQKEKTNVVSNITDTMTTDIDLPEKQRQKKIKFMVDMKLILILIFLHFRLDLLRYDNGFLISFSFFFSVFQLSPFSLYIWNCFVWCRPTFITTNQPIKPIDNWLSKSMIND